MSPIQNQNKKKKPFYKRTWVIVTAVLVVIIFVLIWRSAHKSIPVQLIPVKTGTITETVSVTGNTTPIQSVSLGFQNSGTIGRVSYDVGSHVSAGTVIAALNTGDLSATLKQAQANYTKLLSGATGSDIDVAKAAVATAQTNKDSVMVQQTTAVDNAYRTLLNSGLAVIPSVSGVGTIISPTISGTYTGTEEGAYTITTYSGANGNYFSYSGLENGTGSVSLQAVPLGTRGLFIQFPSGFNSTTNMSWVVSLPNTQASTYLTNYNAYLAAKSTKQQLVDNAIAQYNQAIASLAATQSTARPEDLQIAQAQVDSAQAKLNNSFIIAPISGVITQQDAKVGQVATPSAPLVTIISDGKFEVDAQVPETDIGKLAVGNVVKMKFDAFSGETFLGKVFYIDPAETISQGVVDYKIKVSFDTPDSRMKSGLTANLDIETKTNTNVLILPQYAILVNDSGAFVETLNADKRTTTQVPVKLGIQDQNGNVEILSGVTDGEEVLNIGLKPIGK